MDFKNFLKRSDLDHKEYQEVGVDWCTEREKDDVYCRGGIIADEMGLGKTIMMIGTIIKNFSAPNLIVLPPGTAVPKFVLIIVLSFAS